MAERQENWDHLTPKGFKPKVYVPSGFLFEPNIHLRDKTRRMGRVEFDTDVPIVPLLRYLRIDQKLTQTQIGEFLGVSRSTVGKWLKKSGVKPQKPR